MTKYIEKPVVVEAVQWFKNGDHPLDGDKSQEGKVVGYYRHPCAPGESVCPKCMATMHKHGWIDRGRHPGQIVCPGDWVVTTSEGTFKGITSYKSHIFAAIYEKADKYLKANREAPADKIVEILERRCAFSYGDASITLYDIANEIIYALKGETP